MRGNISRGKGMTRVSIILPTYNRANILEECVNSILAQSYLDWELIISDDASTDNASSIGKKLQKRDSRIHYYRNHTNQGLHKNRNIAISISKGDLIFFIEDDVVLESNCLEILVETFKELEVVREKIGAIAPSLLLVKESSNVPQRKIFDYIKDLRHRKIEKPCIIDQKTGFISKNFTPNFNKLQEVEDVHACSLYPKKIFEKMGGFEEDVYIGNYMYGETDFNFKIKNKGYKLYFQPKAIAYHKTAPTGGCRLPVLTYSYYSIRNHIIFIKRNFGLKSLYMIPCFLFYTFIVFMRYAFYQIMKRE